MFNRLKCLSLAYIYIYAHQTGAFSLILDTLHSMRSAKIRKIHEDASFGLASQVWSDRRMILLVKQSKGHKSCKGVPLHTSTRSITIGFGFRTVLAHPRQITLSAHGSRIYLESSSNSMQHRESLQGLFGPLFPKFGADSENHSRQSWNARACLVESC